MHQPVKASKDRDGDATGKERAGLLTNAHGAPSIFIPRHPFLCILYILENRSTKIPGKKLISIMAFFSRIFRRGLVFRLPLQIL